ncbi:hypothetical protein AS200_45630 (plasmid) [Streptomyces sp. CdTB01]|nr:hypothetical protein AS200_45630 [Streptomyces sp. CdTB01]
MGTMAGFKETIVTKRNTAQQRARELQQAEGVGYHEALNRVREGERPGPQNSSSVVLTDSTLIVIESGDAMRCNACYKTVNYEQWALYLVDVRADDGAFILCPSCAKAIGNAVAHIPAAPAPDREPLYRIPLPAASAPDQVVAYLSPNRVHLLCPRHIPTGPNDYLPVTVEGLEALGRGFRPGGGGRHCSVCNLDVLPD